MGLLGKSPRALIMPVEAQGHWAPILQIMQQLVSKKIDFTVCTTPQRCEELRSYAARGAFGTLEVEFLEVFTDPDTMGLTMNFVTAMMKDFRNFLAKSSFDPSRYTCMISDMFLFFTQDLADEWGIPRYCLITSPSYFGLVILHGTDLIHGGWTPYNPEKRDKFIELPGLEMFTASDVPTAVVDLEPNVFLHVPSATRRAAGLLVNSFEDFDTKSAADLRHQLQSTPFPGKAPPKVFLVGPLLLLSSLKSLDDKIGAQEKHEGLVWLDKQPKASVLFISFGSAKAMFHDLGLSIAKALEETGVPFLWALRIPHEGSKNDVLPHGFEERTQNRGLVVTSWVPQQDILNHPSVGGFLSHCGWNSILESMLAGVPIAGCPMYAEQSMNARHMANAAVHIVVDGEMGQFDAENLTRAITKLMKRQEGEEVKRKVQNLKERAYAAVAEGGSSYGHLQEFLAEISQPPATNHRILSIESKWFEPSRAERMVSV